MTPREGHIKKALCLFRYLKYHYRNKLTFSPEDPRLNGIKFEEHEWDDIYPDAQEALLDKMPTPKTNKIHITVLTDDSHGSDLN